MVAVEAWASRRADRVAGSQGTRPVATLAWAFDLLLRHPHELERLRAEIDSGEGDEYLDAVIKETLGIRPVVPGVVRKLTAPLDSGGPRRFPAEFRLAPVSTSRTGVRTCIRSRLASTRTDS